MSEQMKNDVTAVILAGGQGRRLGGLDKGLVEYNGRPLIDHILEVITLQCNEVIINANRNRDIYAAYDHRIVSDEMTGFQGPLAGFAAAMTASDTDYIITLPCDGPFVPANLVERLAEALEKEDADIAVAHDGKRMQPVYALISRSLLPDLHAFLDKGERKIDIWYARHATALADFSDVPETFFNINTEDDRRTLQERKLQA